MRLLGQARFGVYKDECEGIHPDVIDKYYGVHGKSHRHVDATGAGHPDDEEDNSDSESSDSRSTRGLAEKIAHDQMSHIRHEGIAVPVHGNPFDDDSHEQRFWRVLSEVMEKGITPEGVGLLPNEWEDATYPTFEVLRVGHKGTKEIEVSLADPIWLERAKLWGQALTVLNITQM